MTDTPIHGFDPALDLKIERIVPLSPRLIWAAWTQPEHLKAWFTPAPWKTVERTIDLRPGGLFHTIMRSPAGQEFPNRGCYLEVVENRRLTWTNALLPGFRPAAHGDAPADVEFAFTAGILLEPAGGGTRYAAVAMHRDRADREKHAAMGFEDGWAKALDQLVAHMTSVS